MPAQTDPDAQELLAKVEALYGPDGWYKLGVPAQTWHQVARAALLPLLKAVAHDCEDCNMCRSGRHAALKLQAVGAVAEALPEEDAAKCGGCAGTQTVGDQICAECGGTGNA